MSNKLLRLPQRKVSAPATTDSSTEHQHAVAFIRVTSHSRMLPAAVSLPAVFLGKLWSGEYFRSSTAAANSSAAASTAATAVAAPSTRFLSSERWVVQRCDGQQIYRVQYFGNGDHFYAQVAPTNVTGFVTMAYIRFKQLFAPPR
jgi:hypothetical protein